MAIEFETIQESDAKKYGYEDVLFKLHPGYRREGVAAYKNFKIWAIDREKEIYLVYDSCGRDEESNKCLWNFYYQGKNYNIVVVTIEVEVNGNCVKETVSILDGDTIFFDVDDESLMLSVFKDFYHFFKNHPPNVYEKTFEWV